MSKNRFLKPEKLQNHRHKGKGKGKDKERREEKKEMVALLVFIMATLGILFGRKQLLDAKSPFGDNVTVCKESQFYSLPFGQAVASMY